MFNADEDELDLERRATDLARNHREMLKKLVEMRVAHDLTQTQLAERMGVSQPTVAAFERYDANPTLATIRRYALAVHATLDDDVYDACIHTVPERWLAGSTRPLFWGDSAQPARAVSQWAPAREPRRLALAGQRG